MRFLSVLSALLGAAFLSACLPVSSKIPAGTTVGFKPDPALLGTWTARDKDQDDPAYLHFLGNNDGSMTVLIVSDPTEQNFGEWSEYRLKAATLGANHIVNAVEMSNNGKSAEQGADKQYLLLLYRNDHGSIAFYTMDDKATAAAIHSGAIAGTLDPGQDGDVHITADAASLDAFMASPRAAALFTKPLLVMSRLK